MGAGRQKRRKGKLARLRQRVRELEDRDLFRRQELADADATLAELRRRAEPAEPNLTETDYPLEGL